MYSPRALELAMLAVLVHWQPTRARIAARIRSERSAQSPLGAGFSYCASFLTALKCYRFSIGMANLCRHEHACRRQMQGVHMPSRGRIRAAMRVRSSVIACDAQIDTVVICTSMAP